MFYPWLFFYPWPFVMPSLFSFMSPTTLMSVSAPDWNYNPITEWGEGDQIVERRVSQQVATPGRQLGIMGDALVALVKHLEHPDQPLAAAEQEAIGRLVTMVEMIKPIVAEGTRKEELRKIPVKTVELLQLAKAGKTG